ncbi:MAG: hypothetical protein M1837_006000 [Sclerophora amabilis]|nr:MAG: hypothetical protein M1837_006000 [Sclerophora amabilis]
MYFRASLEELELSSGDPNNSIRLAEGGYLASLGVYHELHCIKKIRWLINFDHYYPNGTQEDQETLREHADHCLEALRTSSMCRADISLITFRWEGEAAEHQSYSMRQCVDWDILDRWAGERAMGFSPAILEDEETDD